MPNVKGATWDPVAKKFIMPEGYVKPDPKTKKDRLKASRSVSEDLRRRDPGPKDKAEAFNVLRQQERASAVFSVFAMYPGQPRAFIGYTTDPTHAAIGAQYGGGSYQVVPYDMATGGFLGDPATMNIDTGKFPPMLPGFKTAQPTGPGGSAGWPMGAPQPGFWPQGLPMPVAGAEAAKLAEVEEEMDDLEDELATAKTDLARALRERDEAQKDLAAEKERAMRQEMQNAFKAEMAEMKALMMGNKKDPLEQLLEFKRVESELNGPNIGRNQGGPGEMMGALMGLFEMVLKAKDKLGEDNPGGATGGFLDTIKSLTPLLEKVMDRSAAAAPVLLTAPASAPAPLAKPAPAQPVEEPAPAAVQEAISSLFNYLGGASAAGTPPFEVGAWIVRQSDVGWDAVHQMVLTDEPANFLDVAKDRIPDAVDTDQKKAWIMAALQSAKDALKEKAG